MNHGNQKISSFKVAPAILMTSLILNTLSCSKTSFVPDENNSLSNPVLFEDTYKVASSEIQYTQPNLDQNNTALSFQVKSPNGMLLQDILKTDLLLTENGLPITDYVLNKNSVTYHSTADIVFAVDVTGSMTSTIESAKQKLVAFVNNTRAQGYHTRMCLSTFGDYTVKKCTRFYNNDPKDASTSAEVSELISEITKLKALKGSADPGGTDLDENPMRAVIDAAAAPWGSDSQRFLILVTDAGFLYSPGHSGSVGAVAPKFVDVAAAITSSQMKIFAVTPSLAGYDKPFGTPASPGIVDQSQGEWYKYADLVSGKITLNTVLNKILSSIDTTFTINYTLTSQGVLDPAKPLSQRNIQLSVIDGLLGTIKGLVTTSNLPNGRPADPKRFIIADKKVKAGNLRVYVDGVLQSKNSYSLIDGTQIEFPLAKTPNAKIKIAYQYESVKDSITLTPIRVGVGVDKLSLIKFTINGIAVDPKYYEAVGLDLNLSTVVLTDEIFGEDDPFKIGETGEMYILIKTR